MPSNPVQKTSPGSASCSNIAGAISASHTTPPTTVAEHGSKYRCQDSVGEAAVMSREATLIVEARSSIV
jgi:hypothetical protein